MIVALPSINNIKSISPRQLLDTIKISPCNKTKLNIHKKKNDYIKQDINKLYKKKNHKQILFEKYVNNNLTYNLNKINKINYNINEELKLRKEIKNYKKLSNKFTDLINKKISNFKNTEEFFQSCLNA